MLRTTKFNQAGDTIVEVMLAVVVVGLAIGLAYGTASRSLKSNRQSQERIEALKKVESQIERLKKRATTDAAADQNGVFRSGSFCIIDASTINKVVPINTPPPLAANDPLGDAYNSTVNGSSDKCSDGLYHLSITSGSGATDNQFEVKARWASLGQGGNEEVKVTYRVYPSQ